MKYILSLVAFLLLFNYSVAQVVSQKPVPCFPREEAESNTKNLSLIGRGLTQGENGSVLITEIFLLPDGTPLILEQFYDDKGKKSEHVCIVSRPMMFKWSKETLNKLANPGQKV